MPSCIYNRSCKRTSEFYKNTLLTEMIFHQPDTNFYFWQIIIEYEKKNNYFVR